jgi:hypothetical protein
MTADTITPASLENLAQYFEIAAKRTREIQAAADRGDISPQDAATDIRLLLRNINALAS